MKNSKVKERKVTLMLPEDLLQKALKASGEGITPTIRKGLELLAIKEVYQNLRKLRGRGGFELDINASREDRSL